MKTLILLSTASILAFSSANVPAADSPAHAASAATAGTTAGAHAKTDAMSVKNDRLRKCKAMQGDEKKACQKDAEADAKKMTAGQGK